MRFFMKTPNAGGPRELSSGTGNYGRGKQTLNYRRWASAEATSAAGISCQKD